MDEEVKAGASGLFDAVYGGDEDAVGGLCARVPRRTSRTTRAVRRSIWRR
ncbi:hypothetical protein [Streptomyces sp. NPDC048641]